MKKAPFIVVTIVLTVVISVLALPFLVSSGSASSPSIPTQSGPAGTYFDHVVIIVMEDHGTTNICGLSGPPCGGSNSPYLSGLANKYGMSYNYLAVYNVSQPNYIALLGGSTFGCTHSGCPNNITNKTLVDQLEGAGLTWKAYMENQNLSQGCDTATHEPYQHEHNPFTSFQNITNSSARCNKIVLANPGDCSVTDCALINDLNSASAPNFMWLTPNDCNNMHSASVCSNGCTVPDTNPCISDGDSYLSSLVPNILNSYTFTTQHASLFITFDEGNNFCQSLPNARNCVYALWAGSQTVHANSSVAYTHYSFLRTVESNWGLGNLTSNDGSATAMTEFFNPAGVSSPISWNPRVSCTNGPKVKTIEQLLGNQTNSNGGAIQSDGGLNSTTSPLGPNNARSWLTNSAFTPKNWTSPGPSCSSFVQIDGVQRGFFSESVVNDTFMPINGGTRTLYPNGVQNDTTFNVFTPGYSSCSSGNKTGCMHGITATIDFDWKGAGYCGTYTTCDRSALKYQTAALSSLIDIQGFFFWNPTSSNDPGHNYSGWELHSVTAWRKEGQDPGITLNANPTSLTIVPGRSASSNISISGFNLFSGHVSLNASASPVSGTAPPSPTPSFSNKTVNLLPDGFASSKLNLTTGSTTTGSWTVTITASNGTLSAVPVTVTVTMVGYAISATPSSFSILSGDSVNANITVTSEGSFQGPVTLTIQSTCGCATPTLASSSLILKAGRSNSTNLHIASSGNGDATITVNATSTAPVFSASTTVFVRVSDFGITSAQSFVNVGAGNVGSTTLFLSSINHFNGTITLSATTSLGGPLPVFNTTSVTVHPGQTLAVLVSFNATRPANYVVTVTATDNGLTHPVSVTFLVVDFNLTAARSIQVNTGSTGTAIITVTSLNSFSGMVTLSDSVPTGLACNPISPGSISGGSGTASIACSSNITANYTLTITGTSGSLTHVIHLIFNFVDFTLVAGAVSPASVNVGAVGNSTITVTGQNGFAEPLSLSLVAQSGLNCSLSTTRLSLPPSPTTGILSCSATVAKDYTVTVTGTNGTLIHSALVLVHIVDFTISRNIQSLTLVVGQNSTLVSVNLVGLNGFIGNVVLNVVSTPSGPSAVPSLSSLKVTTSGNSTGLTIIAGQLAGTYTLNVTATNSLLIHWVSIGLTVTRDSPTLTTALSSSSVVVGGSLSDSAALKGATSTAGGLVSFYVFRNGLCTGPATLAASSTVTSGVVPNSRPVFFNATGTYSFNATYSGDQNNNGASSSCEPLTVIKASPTIATAVKDPTGSLITSAPVGTSIYDSALITGGFFANGTITYTIFSNGICSGTGTTVGSPVTVLNGVVPDSVSTIPTPAGPYSFNATYTGDSNNNPAKSPCEPITITKLTPNITTATNPTSPIVVGTSVTDQAATSGGFPSTGLSGAVVYDFFTNGVCTGSPSFTQTVTIGPANSIPASSTQTPSPAGSYSFNATYSGDLNNNRASSTCEPLTVQRASPGITTIIKDSSGAPVTSVTVGTTVHDSGSLTNGFSPVGGTVSYTFYLNGACAAPGTPAGTVTVTSGVVPSSSTETPLSPGSYSFNATYSGDQNNNGVSSTCETLTVNAKLSPTLTTTVKDSTGTAVTTVNVGSAIHDSAILSGGSTVITGSVTYYFFTNSVCSAPASTSFPPFPQTVTIGSSNSVPDSSSMTLQAGLYSFNATYNGDSQNNVATSTCEPIVVKASPTVTTVIKDSANVAVGSVTVGTVVHDTTTLTGASSTASGSATYTIFNNNACLGTGTVLSTASVTNGSVPDSATTNPSPAGSYSFNVNYTGDPVNNPAKSPCEPLTVLKASPNLTTTIKDSTNSPVTSVLVGTVVHDTATLTGGYLVSGTVTYTTFNNAACVSPGTVLGTPVTITSGAVPDSSSTTPQPAGQFSFNVTYSGDPNNNHASVCEPLSVSKTTPVLSTAISPSTTITVGSSVTDQATLTGGFPTAGITGTVTYNFFNAGACVGTPASSQVVSVGPGNSVPQSSGQTPANAGQYAFNATYSGDSDNNRATSICEPLTVAKQTPTVTTTVNPSSTIVVGTTVVDQATITGGYPVSGVTGTVTYNFFSNGACAGLPASSQIVIVSSGNSVPSSNGQTPSPAGSFAFNATYNGDTNNNPVKSICEPFTVTKASPTVTTAITPSPSVVLGTPVTDHASLTGGFPLSGVTGSVLYRFFNNGVCQGVALSSQSVTVGSGNSVPPSGSQTPTSVGQYSFNVTYSGDLNNNVITSACEPLTITPPATSIITTIKDSTGAPLTTAVVGTSVHDTAVLTGSTASAGGTVIYGFFNNGVCTGTPLSVQTVTVTNALIPDSSATVPIPAGSYSYNGTYSGDANNQPARGACEPLTVNRATPSISTALSVGTIIVGKSASDSATLIGGFTISGTVTFDVFSGGVCVGSPIAVATLSLVSGSAGPSLVTFNSTGTYNWQATYNGDVNNNQVSSSCGSETLTVQKITPSVSTTLSSASIVVGNVATDLATLTGGFAPTGTVTFNVYSGTLCTGPSVASRTATITSASAGPVSVVFNSTANYVWQAVYNGDANNNQASSICGSETLTVIKTTPTISTALSATTAPVNTSVSDTASVSGSFTPTGTVTFSVYAGTTCSGTPIVSKTLALSGFTAGPGSAVFNSTGTFNWQARYNGDGNNNVAISTCGSESLAIQKVTPTVTTSLASNSIVVGGLSTDSASVTGGFSPTGTVTFNIYSGGVCSGTPAASRTASLIGTTAGPVGVPLNSTGTFNWQAVYNGDGNNTIASSTCGTETVSVAKSAPSVSTTLSTNSIIVGGSVSDTALLSGGFSPAGTVTFSIFSSTLCTGTPVDSRTVALSTAGSAGPVSFTFNAAGSYNWQAAYSGDANNNPGSSSCGSETLTVTKATPSVATTLSVSSVIVGGSVTDTATVSSGFSPAGTVTFNVYSGTVCSGAPIASITTPLTGTTSGPTSVVFNSTGTFNWQASYNGDSNNNQALSVCGSETVSVTKITPTISTTLSSTSVVVGTPVTDLASITSGFGPTGTVTFNVYSGGVCFGTPTATKNAPLSAGRAGPVSVVFNSTGVYNWQAIYNGDANNNLVSTACGSETVSVGGALVVTTNLSTSSVVVGNPVSDTATLTGGLGPTGTVTFGVYSGTVCSGTPIASFTVPLSAVSAGPVTVILNSTGTYNFQARYNGDNNNSPTSSICGAESLAVTKIAPIVATILSASAIVVGSSVTDTATVSGFNPTGTVTFNVYSGSLCAGTPVDTKTIALSTSGSAGPVSVTFNIAGAYNWQATYNGDGNNNAAPSTCGSEALAVAKSTPTASTTLSVLTLTVGGSASDTATLSGGFNPTGTVTFKVFSGSVCSGSTVATQTASLASGTAGPVSVIFNNTGTFNWQASYNGDLNNNAATSPCGSESLTISKTITSLTTALSATTAVVGTPVTDNAVVSGGFNPTGTVTFNAYSGSVCTGTPAATQTLSLSGTASGPVSVVFNATGTYNWQATYSGDSNNSPSVSICGSEPLAVNKATPSVSTSLVTSSIVVGSTGSDTATVVGGFSPTGTATFNVYSGSICVGTPIATRTLGLTSGSAGPAVVIFNSTGTLNWQATYDGDSNNNAVSSACGSETLIVVKTSPSITTTLSTGSIVVGNSASDTATVTGFGPTGIVTFNVYSGTVCTGSPLVSRTITLSAGSAGPMSAIFNSTGTVLFKASYSGDGNNNPVSSACGSESLTVSNATPLIATSLSTSTIAVGGSVSDTATLSSGFNPTGTVTFAVYSGSVCTSTPIGTKTVSLSSGRAGPVSIIFNSTGTYNWVATYNGDSNNNPVGSTCGSETVSVGGALAVSTTLSTNAVVVGGTASDTATVTGGVSPTGTVTFNVYAGSVCSGSPITTKTAPLVSGSAGPVAVVFNATGSYNWLATYNGDVNNSPTPSACEALSVVKASPSVSTTLSSGGIVVGTPVTDAALVSNAFSPTGIVTFSLYSGTVCTGSPLILKVANVLAGAAGPVSIILNSTGTFNLQATYSGDGDNNAAFSTCGTETLAVGKATPAVTTTLSATAVVVGNPVADSATLSGGFNLKGTVTFNVYYGTTCGGIPIASKTISLTGNTAGPVSASLNSTGTFNWQASYNGDGNNTAATSPCGSETLAVGPSSPIVTTSLSKSVALVGDSVSDTASVTAGFNPSGIVTFNIYQGPVCSGSPVATQTVAVSTSGVAGPVVVSFTSAGSYTWQASYSGDANNNPASSGCGTENLTVNKATPTVTTTLTVLSVTVGGTVADTSTISGGFTMTGTVTFRVFSSAVCAGTPIVSATLPLVSGTAGPIAVIFNNTGTFEWQATYNGDANNNVASSACGSEALIVTKAIPSVSTALAASSIITGNSAADSAMVSSGFSPTGTVTFNVYSGPLCTGSPISSQSVALSTSGTAGPVSAVFSNAGTYNWQASYSGDSNNNPATSTCGSETLVVNKATPNISTSLSSSSIIVGNTAADTATVSGGLGPTGTVTFTVYSGSLCTGTALTTKTVPLVSGSAGPMPVTFNSTGTFNWQATYNGDGNNNPVLSNCGTETVTVSKASPSINTSLSTGTVVVGNAVSDSASVAGGFGATGSITFNVYSGSICLGTPTASRTLPLSGSTAGPFSVILNSTGVYNWQAIYNGDNNNNVVPSSCGSETASVTKATPVVTTTLTAGSVVVSNAVADSANISGGFAPSGTITFNVYLGTTCLGTSVSSQTVAVSGKSAGPISVTFNATGTYNWQATYNGDTNNSPVSSACGSEVLTVQKTSPTISTSLASGSIVVGGPASDSAIVSGFSPTGTVTFSVYSGSSCSATPLATQTVALSTSFAAGPVSVVFNSAGTYNWQATYNGDANNLAAVSTCGSETLTVTKATPSITTVLSTPNLIVGNSVTDIASVAGGLNPSGTVTFSLYSGSVCSGTPVVSRTLSLSSTTAGPTSTILNSTGTFNWLATYNGDSNNNVATSICGSETLTVSKASPSVSAVLSTTVIAVGSSVFDTATISGGFGPSGTVTFNVYSGIVCTGTPVATKSANLVGNTAVSASVTFNTVGVYNWVAVYNGDASNIVVSSTCGSETLSVGGALAVSTTLSTASIIVGNSVSDTASVSGGVSPTGTITFNVFSGTVCTGTPVATRTVALVSGSAGPVSVVFNATGTYNWQATYNGDANNNPTPSACETLTVNKISPSITTALSSTAITIGGTVTDSSSLSNFYRAGGTVTYEFFSGATCSGTPTTLAPVTVTSGSIPDSTAQTFNAAGPFSWSAVYSGDTNNNGGSSPCEPLAVNKASPTIATTLTATSIMVGGSISDSATLTNAFQAGGTVTYNEFTGTSCSGVATLVSTTPVSNGVVPNSASVTSSSAGTISFSAIYSGDANNNGAGSACEPLTVNKASPTITTALSSSTITIGASVTDSSTMSNYVQATGAVTYSEFMGSACTGLSTLISTVTVTNGLVPSSGSIAPTTAGSYSLNAAYSGDGNNNAATSACEPLTAMKASPTLTSSLSSSSALVGSSVTDSAVLTGGYKAAGSVTYEFFSGSSCTGSSSTVGTVNVTNNAIPNSVPAAFNSAGAFSWSAVYNGDANNNAATSPCEPLAVNKASPIISIALSSSSIPAGGSVTDSATLSAGFQAGGTVTYYYYSGTSCSGTATGMGSPVTVTNGQIPSSGSRVFNTAGSFSFDAVFSGDSNNLGAVSTCLSTTVLSLPVLSVPAPLTINAGSTIRFLVNATDADVTKTISITASGLPQGAAFTYVQSFTGSASSMFSWTPSDSQTGDYTVTFTADDGHGAVATSHVSIHVTAAKQAAPLPLLSYSIFGIIGFLVVLGAAIVLRRLQNPTRKPKPATS